MSDPRDKIGTWVVVDGGLVQYGSGDWGGYAVEVFDLDVLDVGNPYDRDVINEVVSLWERMKDVPDEAIGHDKRRVRDWLRDEADPEKFPRDEWPDGLADA